MNTKNLVLTMLASALLLAPVAAAARPPSGEPSGAMTGQGAIPNCHEDPGAACGGTHRFISTRDSYQRTGTVAGTVTAIKGAFVTITDGKHLLTIDVSQAIADNQMPRDFALNQKIVASGVIDDLNAFHATVVQTGDR